MKSPKKGKEHPEIKNIKNICEVTPKAKTTKSVCGAIKNKQRKR
jgi:hypothetical protein